MDKKKTRLKSVLRQLVQCNRKAESEVDEILRQHHSDYAAFVLDRERDRFMNFDPLRSRLDLLMHETMSGKPAYSELWNIVRMLLVAVGVSAHINIIKAPGKVWKTK